MIYREIQAFHESGKNGDCGGVLVPMFCFLSEEHCLCVQAYCAKCGERVVISFSLSELYKACPKASDTELPDLQVTAAEDKLIAPSFASDNVMSNLNLTDQDNQILRALKIVPPGLENKKRQ